MPRLSITRAIPGAGKTTISRQLTAASHGRLKRICKDDLRYMMDTTPDFGLLHMTQYNELIRDMWRRLLGQGFDVILDETFMRRSDIFRVLAELTDVFDYDVDFEIIDLTQIPFEECLRRDKARERSLGYDVLLDYKQTLEREGTTKEIIAQLEQNFGVTIIHTEISHAHQLANRYVSN